MVVYLIDIFEQQLGSMYIRSMCDCAALREINWLIGLRRYCIG